MELFRNNIKIVHNKKKYTIKILHIFVVEKREHLKYKSIKKKYFFVCYKIETFFELRNEQSSYGRKQS